jgi:Xaa-Pro aminopeptidase
MMELAMKQDLDRLMAERDIDAFVVEGPDGLESANPDYAYFVGARHLPGLVLKRRGAPAMLVHGVMERQAAAETGLVLIPRDRWDVRAIRAALPDPLAAQVEYRRQMFTDLGIVGRVACYGSVKAGPHLALWQALAARMPELTVVAELEGSILDVARATKDADEIAAMRRVGQKTAEVVASVVAYIRAGRACDGVVVDAAGEPITIGRIRGLIGRELAARQLEAGHTIVAQGSDAGLPHALGRDAEALRLGAALVFDIFPREVGGYYHDMTRTFAIGHAPPELQHAYDEVMGAYELVVAELEVGAPTRVYQELVCRYFEERGHATVATTYPLEEGYVHSLGHGLGLEVHEDPRMSTLNDRGEVLAPGTVVTIEPGLYYPSRGFGVRIEDTWYVTEDGRFESLTSFPKELVIPLEG